MKYSVVISKKAQKFIRAQQPKQQKRILDAINKLPDERDIVPLEGNTNAYRLLGHSNYNFTVKNYTHTDVAYLTEQLKKVN